MRMNRYVTINISDRQAILKTFVPFIFRFLSWRRALFACRDAESLVRRTDHPGPAGVVISVL
jgi:hypothetical protein